MDVHELTDAQISALMPTLDERQLSTLCDALNGVLCGVCAAPAIAGGYCIEHIR